MKTSSAASRKPASPAHKQEDLRLGRRIATVGAIALLVVAYVLHAALPATPFQLPAGGKKQILQALVPEGWAFFTLSPREPDVMVYGSRPGQSPRWEPLTRHAHRGLGLAFGLNRRNRYQGTEIALVSGQIPEKYWSKCDRDPMDCLTDLIPHRTAKNFATDKTMCGDIGFVMQEVLPWAWRDLPATMPSKVARVVVTC